MLRYELNTDSFELRFRIFICYLKNVISVIFTDHTKKMIKIDKNFVKILLKIRCNVTMNYTRSIG